MRTSAGIGRHFEETVGRAVARAVVVEGALRALAGCVVALVLVGVTALGVAAVDAGHIASCQDARDTQGFGRSAAFFAFDHPESQNEFLYRVIHDGDGYRVRVVGRHGAFVGEAWERDQDGVARHVTDVCGDQSLIARAP